jgi:hypothetical protein
MSWEGLWKLVLIFTLSAYSVLVLCVIFGGVKNIADMLKDLKKPGGQD